MALFDVSIVTTHETYKYTIKNSTHETYKYTIKNTSFLYEGRDIKSLTKALEQQSHDSSTYEMHIDVCDDVEEARASPASSNRMMIDSSYWTSSKEAQDLVVAMTNLPARRLKIFNFLSFPVPLLQMWVAALGNCNDQEKQQDYTVTLKCDSRLRGTVREAKAVSTVAMAAAAATADKPFRGKLIIQADHLTDWEALRSRLEATFLKPYHPNNNNTYFLEGLNFEFLENETEDFATRMDEDGVKLQFAGLVVLERLCSSVPTRNIKVDVSSAVHVNTVLQALHSNPFPHLDAIHIQSDQLHFDLERGTLQSMTSFLLKIMSTTIDSALFSAFFEKVWLDQQQREDDNNKAMLQESRKTKIKLDLGSLELEGRLDEHKEFQKVLKRVCSFPATSFSITTSTVSARLVSYVLCQSLHLNSSLKCLNVNVKTLDDHMDWVTEEVIQAFQNNHAVERFEIPNFSHFQRTERDKTIMTRKLETIVKSSCSISSLYLRKDTIPIRLGCAPIKIWSRASVGDLSSLTLRMHLLLNESGIRKAMMMRSSDNGTTVLEWIDLLQSCKSFCDEVEQRHKDHDSTYLSCIYYMSRNDMDFFFKLLHHVTNSAER